MCAMGEASVKTTWRGRGRSPGERSGRWPNSHSAKLSHGPFGVPEASDEPDVSGFPAAVSSARAAMNACSRRTPVMTVPRTTGWPSLPCSMRECVRPACPTPVDTPQSDVNTIVTWPLAVAD